MTNVFVAKINASGSALVYSTYLGGSAGDVATALAIDANGDCYVTGEASSTDFPLKNAWQSSLHGGQDAFVSELNSAGSALVYSTYFGGGETGLQDRDEGTDIVTDAAGDAYIVGSTASVSFPVKNPIQGTLNGIEDMFIAEFDATGSLVFSTYLGGSDIDGGRAISLDGQGGIWVSGYSYSKDYPLKDPIQAANHSQTDTCVLSKLILGGTALGFSTYLGGSAVGAEGDDPFCIKADQQGDVYVAGGTESPDFPLMNPFQANYGGAQDAFMSKLFVPSPPSPPTGLTATAGNGQVTLVWTANSGAPSHNVQCGVKSASGHDTAASPR
jgi:hypothetical protein